MDPVKCQPSLSSSERKRRQIYRGEVHGQLPFDAKGMDDNVPTMEMEITSTGINSSAYSIERDDLMSEFTGSSVNMATHISLAMKCYLARLTNLNNYMNLATGMGNFTTSRWEKHGLLWKSSSVGWIILRLHLIRWLRKRVRY